MMKKYQVQIFCYDAVISDEYSWIDIENLEISTSLLEKMAELDIIEIHRGHVRGDHIPRIYKALRLRKTLGVNLAGAGIIIHLLERLDELSNEVEQLKRNHPQK